MNRTPIGIIIGMIIAGFAGALLGLVLVLGIDEPTSPAPATSQPDSSTATTTQRGEPYGGCDEAWQAPESEGYAWCVANGKL